MKQLNKIETKGGTFVGTEQQHEEYMSKFEEGKTIINSDAIENVKDLKTMLAEGVPQIEWRVENILPKSGISIFGGTAGSMKSWAGMQLALACATGTDFLNQFETKKCNVLYMDEENGNVTIPFRFDKLVKGHGLNPETLTNLNISIFNNVTLDDPQGKHLLKNQHQFQLENISGIYLALKVQYF